MSQKDLDKKINDLYEGIKMSSKLLADSIVLLSAEIQDLRQRVEILEKKKSNTDYIG